MANCNSQFIEMFAFDIAKRNGWECVPVSCIIHKPLSGEWGQDDTKGIGVKVLRTTNFTDIGSIDFTDVVTRIIEPKKIAEKAMRHGDILIEKSGGTDTKPVGRVVFFQENSENYLFNNFTALLRCKDDRIDCRYLFAFLFVNYSLGGTKLYENKTTGIHNLKLMDYLENTLIPVPPIEIQKRFSSFAQQSDKSKFAVRKLSNLNLSGPLPIRI